MVNFLRPRRHRPAEPIWLYACFARACASRGIAAEHSSPDHGGGDAMSPRLNALFAISGNNPLVSMVNFPSCVCSAFRFSASGVTPRVTPQPMRAAVRMKAGVDAYLGPADRPAKA